MATPVAARSLITKRDVVRLVLAAACVLLGSFLVRLEQEQGLAAQRINLRWAENVSPSERSEIERQASLVAVEARGPRTWSYVVGDRSRRNIERLVRDPRVEDTAHVDRTAFRVALDRPDLHPWVRWFLGTEQADTAGYLFVGVAAWLAWGERRRIARGVGGVLTIVLDGLLRIVQLTTRTRARPAWWEHAAGIAFALTLLAPLLARGPHEEEIVQATILPNQIFYRALFGGEWLFWLNDLGFGSPMPLGDPLLFHPVFAPLAAFASLRTTLSAVWIVHSIVMVVYFLRLAAVSGIGDPAMRLVVLLCYVASMPFVLYFLDSDWVQMAITWTLYPVLVFHLRSALLGGARADFWRTACGLAFLFGFWILNAHPAYIMAMALVLTVYAVTVAPWDRRVYSCLLTAAALCVGITAARIYALVHEMRLFPPEARGIRDGTVLDAYFGAIAAPLVSPAYRGPFIGAGIGAAVVVGLIRLSRLRDPHLRGCIVACVAAAGFNVFSPDLTSRVLPAVSNWVFRDPMLFFGLLAGGALLQSAIRGRFGMAAALLVLLQIVQQYAVMHPDIRAAANRNPELLFYRYQGQAVGLGRLLVDRAAQFGPRLYLSPEVDAAMRGDLSADGIHFSSDLILLGLNPVNGWFKNVSMTALYPPESLMESFILGDVQVIRNQTLLNVLGVDLVLSTEHETGLPPALTVTDRPRLRDATRLPDLILFANRDAWPRAVLLEPNAYATNLPVRAGCTRPGALCLDYDPLARQRAPGDVVLRASNGHYLARVAPADHERLLFISATYRPEWEATAGDGRALAVRPVATAFLGVTVPPGVTEVSVRHSPRTLIALTWASSALFFGVGAVAWLRRSRPVPRPLPQPEPDTA
jgi:hypothetical protein